MFSLSLDFIKGQAAYDLHLGSQNACKGYLSQLKYLQKSDRVLHNPLIIQFD